MGKGRLNLDVWSSYELCDVAVFVRGERTGFVSGRSPVDDSVAFECVDAGNDWFVLLEPV